MIFFGLPLGIIAGYYRNKAPDNIINGITVIGNLHAYLLVRTLLIYIFFFMA